jgi:archaeosortase B (VPXXXP-CTERM-specific)
VEIIDECTGLFEMLIYIAAVAAFSTSIRKRLLGMAIGIPAIFLFNLARIIFLLLAGAYSKSLFDFMHLYFWQATLIIMISSVWIGWLYLVVYREKRTLEVSS